jgi:gliding motility-associated-like protein
MTKRLFQLLAILLFTGSASAQAICDSVTAGPDQTVCAGTAIQLEGASPGINNIVSTFWTGGNGTYVPNNNVSNPLYYPTAAEIAAGQVDLQYQVTYSSGASSIEASLLAYDHSSEDSVFYISPIDGSIQGVQSNSGNDLTAIGYQSATNLLFGISNIVEPANLYQIDVVTNNVTLLLNSLGNYFWAGDFDNTHQLFYTISTPSGVAQTQSLYAFDFSLGTPVMNYIGSLNLPGDNDVFFFIGGDGINGLAYDPNTSKLYGASHIGQLYDINTTTGNATLIGNCQPGLRGLAFDYTTNKLWGCDASANLYEIDQNTGALLSTVNCQGNFSVVTSLTYAPGLLNNQENVTCVDSVHIEFIDCEMNCMSEISTSADSCVQTAVSFTVLSDSLITNVLWNFGDPNSGANNTSGSVNTNHTFSAAGSYVVSAIVTSSCGIDTLFEAVAVVDCEYPEVIDCQISVPNVFTPNGDSINDVFSLQPTCTPDQYNFIILNRWGGVVYTATGPADKWNGKYNGTDCDEGVYFYVATYQFPLQEPKTIHGTVTLLRN